MPALAGTAVTGPELAGGRAVRATSSALALLVIVADIARPGDERATIVIGTIGTLVGIALVVAVGLGRDASSRSSAAPTSWIR